MCKDEKHPDELVVEDDVAPAEQLQLDELVIPVVVIFCDFLGPISLLGSWWNEEEPKVVTVTAESNGGLGLVAICLVGLSITTGRVSGWSLL